MKISVIVPVYNGSKYLSNLIESILNQKNINIELILVDDGSNDDSYTICEHYEQIDFRVRVIKKENGGICSARNAGLQEATGEWISFVDQDDTIENDMYLVMEESIEEDVDMIVAGKSMYVEELDGKISSKKEYIYPASVIEKKDLLPYQTNIYKKNELSQLWNCLYKSSILKSNNIWFNTIFKYGFEDTLFNLEYTSKCKKIKFVNKSVYNYYRRKTSSTSFKHNENYLNELVVFLRVANDCLNSMQFSSPEKECLIYQFLLKHCINLYSMYSIHKSIHESKNDLQVISSSLKNIGKPFVKRNKFISFTEYIYTRLVSFLLLHNCYILLKMLIGMKKRL